jgi:hypothetical protein
MNSKIDFGNVLERVFRFYGEQFGLLIPAALVLFVPVALLSALLLSSGGVLLALVVGAIGIVATYWFQGMVVEAVRDILDGRRDHSVGSLFQSVTPVIGPLIIAGILAGVGIGIGLVLVIVPGLFLLTIWAVVAPVIVVERAGVIDAFGRSRELVKGNGWPVFGVIIVLFLISAIAGGVLQGILNAISDSFVGHFIAQAIVNVLVSPLSAIAAAVLYFELKGVHGEPVESFSGTAGAPGTGTPQTQEQPAAAPPAAPEAMPPPAPRETGPAQPGEPPPPERP